MLDCLIIGDSIAVGVAEVRRDCDSIAVVGIGSEKFNRRYGTDDRLSGGYSTVVISLGTNDRDASKETLLAIRDRIGAERVLWILPPKSKPTQRAAVMEVAKACQDGTISTADVSPDGIHPTARGYKTIGTMF